MAYGKLKEFLQTELKDVREAGLYKEERFIYGPQGAGINVEFPAGAPKQEVLNFCANNYLGLSSHPETIKAAHTALDEWGYGLSSVRFICGTQDIHRQLERKIADFLELDDAILYSSCFDANGGLFEVLFKQEDAILTDALNHASVIDGIRLSKAKRYIVKHMDLADLEAKLASDEVQNARFRIFATDGAFSMDGDVAPLEGICDLCEKYDCLVMVDDSHSTGFMGKHGKGTHEHCGVLGRVDIITSTMGKALGGASGGFTAARKEIVDILRQRSRPYLFSNSLPPVIAASAITIVDLLARTTERRDKLEANTMYFREKMTAAGFDIRPGVHPIVPIMLYNAKLAQDMAKELYAEGIYVIGFFYPVVGKGLARIRVQLSAAHELEHIDKAIAAFKKVGEKYGILGKSKEEIIARYGE
ncbi:MAG TPA: glycine C-acetyltransferase [candidate division WOR-3 bacterium]|uniref:2-amino-3-ketobutyrate coenzyme A ligase n=1 Tax=candidate division WOR-3 bacterium TaxID=2052148 RepID=A0A7V0T5P2_UNCW3|nr:glycine C-acetyltransferase [candidate division WOR-3 bacterium]